MEKIFLFSVMYLIFGILVLIFDNEDKIAFYSLLILSAIYTAATMVVQIIKNDN